MSTKVKKISGVGGKNVTECTGMVLSKIMSNDVALKTTFSRVHNDSVTLKPLRNLCSVILGW